ncbi:GHMP family kinase ATP-binding protein [Crateriforma conspicua]|uniref:Uncharacterized protein n=1 Tax=Crateriforma conspicua TaxID=2527996 RepID=A0A5C5Y867_9PLAN|nr:beta-ribofuranosylaminobenzene 5'-phosphate synthase [Crateriforma conspicua]QDV65276.1 hypothetical protein Mal65_44460 [Crateriforma conspicua]TWT70671.1 hypothetical protein Pan14r_29780 [Crateriforma conspicua]
MSPPKDPPPHGRTSEVQTAAIQTGARLHFGLLDTAAPFGGCGVMIEDGGVEITITPDSKFSVTGIDDSTSVHRLARHWQQFVDAPSIPSCRLHVSRHPRRHCGLGSGTQMALAVCEALFCAAGQSPPKPQQLVRIANRGHRSAIGCHGYFHGGFLCEESLESPDLLTTSESDRVLRPLAMRCDLPSHWRVVILIPKAETSLVHGRQEKQLFATINRATPEQRERLTRWLREEIVPRAKAGDFNGFTRAVARYNYHSGELFAQVQGGPYRGPVVAKTIERAKSLDGHGVGQSSWGPGVFAWFENQSAASDFARQIPTAEFDVIITRVRNQPRTVQSLESGNSPPPENTTGTKTTPAMK